MGIDTEVGFNDTASLDAFARLRVSNPFTIFDSKQIHDNQPLFWDEALESGAGITSAHDPNTASTVITSTLNTAGVFTRQTFMCFNYQPGKSQLVLMTGVLNKSGGGTGVIGRGGMFTDDNGIFFEGSNSTVYAVIRSNATGTPVDNAVARADWNVDRMDGSGPSRHTLDFTKSQIIAIDFEWLGVGRVRMGFVIDGIICYVHQFLHANTTSGVYMSSPNLPLRFQLITTASSPASSMECICASVMSEGGDQHLGILHHEGTEGTHVDCATENTLYAVVGIRLRATHVGASVEMIAADLAEHVGNKNVEWHLMWNPTVAGSPTWTGKTGSSLEYFRGAAANVVTNGYALAGGFFSSAQKGGGNGSSLNNALRLGMSIAGVMDTIVLAARPVGGSTNIDIEGSLSWRETP